MSAVMLDDDLAYLSRRYGRADDPEAVARANGLPEAPTGDVRTGFSVAGLVRDVPQATRAEPAQAAWDEWAADDEGGEATVATAPVRAVEAVPGRYVQCPDSLLVKLQRAKQLSSVSVGLHLMRDWRPTRLSVWLTPAEAQRVLGISRRTLYRALGELRSLGVLVPVGEYVRGAATQEFRIPDLESQYGVES